jgi:hypothetical protein
MKKQRRVEFSEETKLSDGMVHFISKPKICASTMIGRCKITELPKIWEDIEILFYDNPKTTELVFKLFEKHGTQTGNLFNIKIFDDSDSYWDINVIRITQIDFGFISKENVDEKFNVPKIIKMIISVDDCKFKN